MQTKLAWLLTLLMVVMVPAFSQHASPAPKSKDVLTIRIPAAFILTMC